MSWLWGTRKKAEVEEELSEEEEETHDESHVENANDETNGQEKPVQSGSDNPNDNQSYKDSSDESSVENASESEEDSEFDDDDDSLVVDLIESMTTDDDDDSEDDISLVEATPGDAIDAFKSNGDDDEGITTESPKWGAETTAESKQSTKNKARSKPQEDADEADNDDPVASFWEKQSLLILAAEHDRVDILKTLVKDENEEKDALLNSGIPPLHLAISFGSMNTAQSLLRMGADPNVRPNIDEVIEQRKNQPEDSKVDIPNIRRFDSISAWELAFGNALYEKTSKLKKSWSLFGSAAETEDEERIIKPVDMPPSKREGIRHAFTAEALRSIGSDEVERLKQLVGSGMPSDIDIGGKDLYGWAVEMGALQCEEYLRPVEAAKYEETENKSSDDAIDTAKDETPATETNEDAHGTPTKQPEENNNASSFVVHRPADEETIPQLKNRLDELDSLSTSLSVCLDNLAEEVSVCHGLLLMGGGASALASHVRSLRDSKEQKLIELEDAEAECLDVERELVDLIHSTGDIGKEISKMSNTNFLSGDSNAGCSSTETESGDDKAGETKVEAEKRTIKAQIAASEHKVSIDEANSYFHLDLCCVDGHNLKIFSQ